VEIVETTATFRAACGQARAAGLQVGFVPTMGALHDGHFSLIRRAREENDNVACSIFVNPLQFGETEELEEYPRDIEKDSAAAEAEGVDTLFVPSVEQMYPDGYPPPVSVDPGPLGDRLEGASRPGHFRGVLTVVARLLDLAGESRTYLGEKDAQQLFLVTRMVRELGMPTEVVPCGTVREPDGLALSSRNLRLSAAEREAAVCLYRALKAAQGVYAMGERDVLRIQAEMARCIGAESLATIDYAEVVDASTFESPDGEVPGSGALALVAANIGRVRLIDSLLLASG
jgi:pantoate--beta-alanine ligase